MTSRITVEGPAGVIGRLQRVIRNARLRYSNSLADRLSRGGNVPKIQSFKSGKLPDDKYGHKQKCKLCGSQRAGKYIVLDARSVDDDPVFICANLDACIRRGKQKEQEESEQRARERTRSLQTLDSAIKWPGGDS
jgi:hypothetical protein